MLREIVYLDRGRVESYISQLQGSLITGETEVSTETQKSSGEAKLDLKVIAVGGSRGTDSAESRTTSAVPAHAILKRLESLLNEHQLLVDANRANALPGQLAKLRGDATFESWGMLAPIAESVQGVAEFGVKIWGAKRAELMTQLEAVEKRIRKGQQGAEVEATVKGLRTKMGILSAIEDRYISDMKNLIRLFFEEAESCSHHGRR